MPDGFYPPQAPPQHREFLASYRYPLHPGWAPPYASPRDCPAPWWAHLCPGVGRCKALGECRGLTEDELRKQPQARAWYGLAEEVEEEAPTQQVRTRMSIGEARALAKQARAMHAQGRGIQDIAEALHLEVQRVRIWVKEARTSRWAKRHNGG